MMRLRRCYIDQNGYTSCRKCDIEDCGPDDVELAEEQDSRARRYNSNK
jgi:hypothetical protein